MHFKLNNKTVGIIAIALSAALLLSLLPILAASFYAHPMADDYGFSAGVHHTVQNGGGVFDVLSTCFQTVKDVYFNWQGTYSAVFIFSIQPAAFSEDLYFLTAFVMLTALIASTFYLINTVFAVLGFDKKYGIIITCIILLLTIHLFIDLNQAFYWWNGCSYYTLFYSFSLIFYSLLIKMYFSQKQSRTVRYFIIALFLAAIIGGGNYSTGLITVVILAFVLLFMLRKKNKKLFFYLAIFIVLLTGFIISMAAPGNSVRAQDITTGVSPVKAVILSIFYSFVFFAKWTGLAQLSAFAVIAAIACYLTKNSKYEFKYPLLVSIITFLIYATQFTPPFYAMGSEGSERQINIYYYSYYLFITLNIFYYCGWLNKKKLLKINAAKIRTSYVLSALLIMSVAVFCGCINHGVHKISFVNTLLALKNNTPQTYNEEYYKKIEGIQNGQTELEEFTVKPDFFGYLGIQENPNYFVNRDIRDFYDAEEITLKPSK